MPIISSMGAFPKVSGPPTGVGLVFDVSMWPLVLITMPPVMVEEDIIYMRECYEHVFSAPTRHALIVDTTKIARVPEATMRRQLKEFEDSNRPIIREKNIGSAIIIQNAIVRGAYTALRWISPQPAPNKAFSTIDAAARWCIEGIEGDGQIVPIAAYAVARLANRQASG